MAHLRRSDSGKIGPLAKVKRPKLRDLPRLDEARSDNWYLNVENMPQ
jgi:hypothetical protein